jgi:cytochrome c-type biogenesis protein CcmF
MSIGTILIYLSLILAIAGILSSYLRLKTKEDKFLQYSRIITIFLFAMVTLTLLYLYVLFFIGDVSIEYVWKYSSITHPLQYKFAGVLAGMAGSLLFWIWAIVLPWFYEEMKTIKKYVDEDTREWTRIALFSVVTVLIFVLSLHDIFKSTAVNLLNSYPNGQGLNPLLQTELMIVHPPIVFIAYGFMAVAFAAALAHFITGHKDWILYSLKWSRIGWIFLTLGIGIGALWAYVVLGWGGYWAWDPVETSSLLPWIILTGFLHAQLMYKRKEDYPILAPILGVFSFILVIFATFVTRAGGIWVSVHTFGAANVQIDPWQRFMNILGESQTVLIYMIFIIVSLIITIFLVIYRYYKNKKSRKEQFYNISELINDDLLMLATIFLFVIITIVTLVMLINSVNGYDPTDFNINVGVLCLATTFILIFCLLWRYTGRRWITIIGGFTLLATVIGFILFPDNRIFVTSLPILLVALIGTGYKIIRSVNTRKVWKSTRLVSAHLIHLAAILLIIGYVGSNFMVVEDTISLSPGGPGEEVDGYIISALYFNVVNGINFVNIDADSNSFIYQTEYIDIRVSKEDNTIGDARLINIMSTSLINDEVKLLRKEIKVVDTLFEDIYLNYEQAYLNNQEEVDSIGISVKTIPLMKLVWGGMWLMAVGMVLRVLTSEKILPSKRITRRKRTGKIADKKIKDDEYYENLLEDELKD